MGDTDFCECGCGKETKEGNMFIFCHQNRGKNNPFYGKNRNVETRKKISETLKGKYVGKNASMFGKRHSIESKKLMSEARKGTHHSDKTRRMLSELNSGKNNPMYGKQHSVVTRQKISEARTGKCAGENHHFFGKHHSVETNEKISETKKALWQNLKYRKNHSGENAPMFGKHHSDEAKKKISEATRGENNPMYGKSAMKGKHHSVETRKKMSKSHSGENNSMFGKHRHHSSETRKKIGEASKTCWQDPEYKKKMSAARIGKKNHFYGKHHSAEAKKKIRKASEALWQNLKYRKKRSEVMEALWRDPEFVKNLRDKWNLKPNMLEQDFDSAFPELKFVGDFSFFVGSKNPDFILPDTNVCVDVFGDHWHEPKEVHERKKYFKEFGYDLTIVWEHEWKGQREQIESQVKKIIQANRGGLA